MIDGTAEPLGRFWTLDPEVTFLNHGSFGACPRVVLDAQRALRDRMEREPVEFFVRDLEELAETARAGLGRFIGADPGDLAFVPNATAGVNSILRSLDFHPGDELVVTDHEYQACRNALDFAADRAGARVVVVPIPFPLDSPEQVLSAVLETVTPRTRLALLDHVTSPTGMVLPIRRIVNELKERGIETLVDGAHAPGMLSLDVTGIGASFYTGNCHKWLCAPKGAGFLWVRGDRQEAVRPLSISHGAKASATGGIRFRLEFDWTGTHDPTPYLCVPEAIDFLAGLLPGGCDELMERNRALALQAREILCSALGIPAPCPDEMVGSLAAFPLPDSQGPPADSPLYDDPLHDLLIDRFRIEVPVVPWPHHPRRVIRVSAQAYNHAGQYRQLARALTEIL